MPCAAQQTPSQVFRFAKGKLGSDFDVDHGGEPRIQPWRVYEMPLNPGRRRLEAKMGLGEKNFSE